MPSIMSGGNQAPLITWPIPSLQSGLVMAASYGGDVLQQQELEDYSELRGRWMQKCKETSSMRTCSRALGWRFIFQQDNNPKHTAKITKERLRDNSVNVHEWPSQSPDLNPSDPLWRNLKMAEHSPSDLMELERSCTEEWEKLPKNRCAKLVASYSKRLEAVIGAKISCCHYVELWGKNELNPFWNKDVT